MSSHFCNNSIKRSTKVIPRSIGYKNTEFVVFLGMAFIIVGVSKSRISKSFNPMTNKSDATIKVKYPPIAEAKTLPVRAQTTPITVNTIAVPKIKQQSCKNVLKGVSFEYPPT